MIFLGSVDPYGLKEPSEMEDKLEEDSGQHLIKRISLNMIGHKMKRD